jgi:hypothetical protein
MNFLKLSMVAASAALIVGSGTKVHAFIATPPLEAGTYTFEASNGQPTFANGSTVTFTLESGQLVLTAWDLLDPSDDSIGFPLTQSNSEFSTTGTLGGHSESSGVLSVSNDQWGYNIVGDNIANQVNEYAEIGNDLSSGYYYDGNEDPTGTYTMDPVPDSSSTFELLAGALIAVATVASRKRNRAACGA